MTTVGQRRAAKRIRKAVKEAKRQRTIVRLSPKTRKDLAKRGVKAARRPR